MDTIIPSSVAKRMFLDTRAYAKDPNNYGKDIKQLLIWHMRQWFGKELYGEAHRRERDKEIERFMFGLSYPRTRKRFCRLLTELLKDGDKATESGLVTRGNPTATLGAGVKTSLSPGELDEVEPYERARVYCSNMRIAAQEHPFLFYWVMVFRMGCKGKPKDFYAQD